MWQLLNGFQILAIHVSNYISRTWLYDIDTLMSCSVKNGEFPETMLKFGLCVFLCEKYVVNITTVKNIPIFYTWP